MNTGTQRSQDLLSKQNPKSALSVLEETSQLMEGQKKHHQNAATNIADQTDKGPLFNFYQCTEVLHQLSSTSRGAHTLHSSKNRSII